MSRRGRNVLKVSCAHANKEPSLLVITFGKSRYHPEAAIRNHLRQHKGSHPLIDFWPFTSSKRSGRTSCSGCPRGAHIYHSVHQQSYVMLAKSVYRLTESRLTVYDHLRSTPTQQYCLAKAGLRRRHGHPPIDSPPD
jgi:hypothetical protein